MSKRKGMLIKRVLVNVNECTKTKTTYTGDPFFHKNKGKEAVILEDSAEETIIADWIEENMGYRNDTMIVSAHRIDEGLGVVGRSAVMNAANRIAPFVTKVQNRNQGNKHQVA